jgi:DNA-binding beta-propeller fold protein YncE
MSSNTQIEEKKSPAVSHFGMGEVGQPQDVHCTKNKIFVSNSKTDTISVFDRSDLSMIASIGGHGDQNGQFDHPLGIASFGDKLYIVDCYNHRVCIFEQSDYSFVTSFGGKSVMTYPNRLCFCEKSQRLYVTDQDSIVALNIKDYSLHKQFKTKLDYPHGICLSPNGSSLFVVEYNLGRIVEVDINNDKIVRSVESLISDKGEIYVPIQVRLSADGEYLLVSNSGKHRISVFKTSDLSFIKHIGSSGNQASQLQFPKGFDCDENGIIFVADSGNERITILNL